MAGNSHWPPDCVWPPRFKAQPVIERVERHAEAGRQADLERGAEDPVAGPVLEQIPRDGACRPS